MKKPVLYAIMAFLLVASFLAGYGYRKGNPSAVSVQTQSRQSDKAEDENTSNEPGTVRVTPEKQQLMGIRTVVVEKSPESHVLRVPGRIAVDETRVYRINASVDGWIRDTYSNTTGSIVKKDEVLATFYSPEFLSAQQAYIYALGSMDRFKRGKEPPQQISLTELNMKQYRDSLRTLGMSEVQIGEIGRNRQYTEKIEIRAPATGFITLRNVTTGLRFDKGTELYRIADLRRIWILADLFENEARYVQPGKTVRVSLPRGGKAFSARVSSVLPQFDPATRTLKVRLEADNPGFILRPDMFVDVELPVTFPPSIAVPADSVLDSGVHKTVFVDRGGGFFEPREVETGWRFGSRVEIVRGLEPGERIVVGGNFLIDSESRMELAAAGMYGTLSQDPVCGAKVAVRKAEKMGRKSVYQGKVYYFSSDACKQAFEKDRERYAEKPVDAHD